MSTPKLLHEKCKYVITSDDIKPYTCRICGTQLIGPSFGRYEICIGCSEEFDLCERCGKPMSKEKENE